MSKVILNSGGMDSFFVAIENPGAKHVFVDIGQAYLEKELLSASRIADHVGTDLIAVQGAQITRFEHQPSGIIPLRNAELILCAGQFGDDILLGILANEVNSDKSQEFLRAMECVMTISCRPQYWSDGRNFRIHTPLGTRSKTELVRDLWQTHGPDSAHWKAMLQTVSCYDGGSQHCGACPSCFKRWVALTAATGRDYGAHFAIHPASEQPLSYWQAKGYNAQRIEEIEAAYAIAGTN